MKDTTERKRITTLRKIRERLWSVFMILIIVAGGLPSLSVVPVQASTTASPAQQVATTNTLSLAVVSAANGAPITNYRYMINKDNTGTTTQRQDPATGDLPVDCTPAGAGYPGSCDWVSIAGVATSR